MIISFLCTVMKCLKFFFLGILLIMVHSMSVRLFRYQLMSIELKIRKRNFECRCARSHAVVKDHILVEP
jgi:hypothetical protein